MVVIDTTCYGCQSKINNSELPYVYRNIKSLKKSGYIKIRQETGNGKIALERVQEKSPGVIFLDLMMPEMDGFEFIEELKKNPEHRPIPIVVVTSKDITQADRLRLNGGVAKLIEKKSFVHDDLLSEIRSTLNTHSS